MSSSYIRKQFDINRPQAEINETLVQELLIELWDYDGYFPGVQNDDFLGRLV